MQNMPSIKNTLYDTVIRSFHTKYTIMQPIQIEEDQKVLHDLIYNVGAT